MHCYVTIDFLLMSVLLFMKPLSVSAFFCKLFLGVSFAGLVACTTTPFEEPEDLSAPQGPGVFTGDKGEFSVTDFFDADKKKRAGGGYYILDLDGAPPMTEEQFKEFESFRAWLRSREEGTEEHKEYESWRAFQQYRSLQAK
jgi:hypothetical protein